MLHVARCTSQVACYTPHTYSAAELLRGNYCAFLCRESEAEAALAPWLAGLRLVEATDDDTGEVDAEDSGDDSDGAGMQDLFG